ncbi:FKBP-type peptidyl-prolyl cis-trans isomerase [Crocinitomicaceae bacterium]|jgi:FKBP-type peptidyl-prolyl cis-trans isomerase|nr:FKBP-type peptidyl-prolyl cis-trans isomerase [Flavobacteriales bacterium]MDC1266504.1 FKBP-type peptidyl-prolyl cis-trans isomerase [Crocinitomicaceae bacterium]
MKKTITIFLFAIMFFNVNGQSPLKNEVDSISYLIGQSIAKNVLGQMGEANKDMIMKGMGDGLYEIPALCSDPNNAMLNAYFQEKNRIKEEQSEKENQLTKIAGEKWLEENKKNKDVQVTESGLQYIILEKGNGPKPTATSKVKVHYHGTTPYDVVFDSSVDRGEPITFGLNQVIKGWTEGVQLMPVGSKFKFFIPQELAYGANPQPGSAIMPYMPLVFEVELLEIVPE